MPQQLSAVCNSPFLFPFRLTVFDGDTIVAGMTELALVGPLGWMSNPYPGALLALSHDCSLARDNLT
jgi:hypothetical protein